MRTNRGPRAAAITVQSQDTRKTLEMVVYEGVVTVKFLGGVFGRRSTRRNVPGGRQNSQPVEALRVAGCTRKPPRSRIMKPVGVSVERERRRSMFCGCASTEADAIYIVKQGRDDGPPREDARIPFWAPERNVVIPFSFGGGADSKHLTYPWKDMNRFPVNPGPEHYGDSRWQTCMTRF